MDKEIKRKEPLWRILIRCTLPPKCKLIVHRVLSKVLLATRKDLDFFYDAFYALGALKDYKLGWAEKFSTLILKTFNPTSVIDFGCSIGVILSSFEKKGIEILGIDGSKMSKKYSLINKDNFVLFDLRDKYDCGRKYDLCLCLELGEHIEEKYSDILVGNLVRSSSTIIFSAAPPSQTGDCHFNLKPYEWWIEKFKKFNFALNEELTNNFKKKIQDIPHIPSYYRSNILIFEEQ